MNTRKFLAVSATAALLAAASISSTAYAHEGHEGHWRHHEANPQEHAAWIKRHLDREAAMLEIKASQEGAWEAYAAAAQEVAKTHAERKMAPENADAASTLRLHAEQAALFAQRMGKLADAAEALQSVLNDEQRKVFDRIVRLHAQFHGGRHGNRFGRPDGHWGAEDGGKDEAGKSAAPKSAPPAKQRKPS